MDVSDNKKTDQGKQAVELGLGEANKTAQGQGLLEEVASLTGLPQEWMQTELHRIVTASGHQPSELTLDELRASMLAYLEQMMDQIPAEDEEVQDLIPGELPN